MKLLHPPPNKRSQCGALVEPSSGIKKTPPCNYHKFQQQHRGVWQGRQRCAWPSGNPGCKVCVNLGLSPPEDVGLSPVEKQAPSATAVVPVEPVPDLSTSNRHQQMQDMSVIAFIHQPCRQGIFSTKVPHRRKQQKFPVWCSKCECVIDCRNQKGIQKIVQHERTKKHGAPHAAAQCTGALLKPEEGCHHRLGRLRHSLCQCQPYVPTTSPMVLITICDSTVRVQSSECARKSGKVYHGGLCTDCWNMMHNRKLARTVGRFATKLDELEFLRLSRAGDTEALKISRTNSSTGLCCRRNG